CVASLNTHDMPLFAAFWQGLDIQERIDLGILDASALEPEQRNRQALLRGLVRFLREKGHLSHSEDPQAVLQASLSYLASGPSLVTLANLEDCWLETKPQNVPGTWRELPNWRRRSRYSLETLK